MKAGGQDGARQGLVDGLVDDLDQGELRLGVQGLPDAVEDDDGVVEGVAERRRERGDDRQVDLPVQNGEDAHGEQGVVDERRHGPQGVGEPKLPARSRVMTRAARIIQAVGAPIQAQQVEPAGQAGGHGGGGQEALLEPPGEM